MEISGFTFVHNAIDSGYPIIEAIETVMLWVDDVFVVDMESTDNTRQVLEKLDIRIIDGKWGNEAGKTLADAHSLNSQCSGDIIIHFEADEIYPESLLQEITYQIDDGHYDLLVWRLQLEQNFQRCRWYPELVHRVFPKGTVNKDGHTTNMHRQNFDTTIIPQEYGYLWDITNCFRDNWLNRINKQAELRQEKPNYLHTPIHTTHARMMNDLETVPYLDFFEKSHWEWKQTPFNIPDNLKSLVGVTRYSESKSYRRLMG